MPTTGKCAAPAASRVSCKPTGPKSTPWLLAMVTTSMPAERSAVKALGGARKVYFFTAGAPLVVIAVSRLTIARSALDNTAAIGPIAVVGSALSLMPSAPSKCTSPPKAMVNEDGLAGRGETVVGNGDSDAEDGAGGMDSAGEDTGDEAGEDAGGEVGSAGAGAEGP